MAGDSILIRRKDVIAGKGIAIEPSGVSAAIRIINTEVDSERLLPVNPAVNDIPIYKQMDAEGNGEDVKLLIQSPATASQVADTAAGVVTHATVTAHGSLGVDDRGLLFDGNTYLEIDKNNVQSILTGGNPWCFDLYITGSEEVTSSYVQIGSLFTDNNDYVINWGMIDGKVNAVNIPAWGTIEGFTAGEPHLLTIEHYISAGASTIALYCDNVRRSVISNVILPTANENLWIGKGPVGYFKGWLDYIRIRNTAPYQSSTITPDPTPYLAAGERWTVINLSEIEGGGGTTPTDVDWNDIQNKPSTFPPSAHTHIISDVTGLSDVAVKAHTHENKTTLDKFGEVNNKPTFNGEEIGSGVSSWNDLEDKPTTFPPSEHTHQIADVSGLQDSLDSKVSSVNGQTGAVTIPNASATEAGLMSAADKSKLDGIDTTDSTGDMLKSVYDTNNDGIVDHAAVADAIGTATATQVETAVSQSHTHENKETLDKLGDSNGKLTYNGTEIGSGGSGGASSLAGLSDTANIADATNGQVLTYNATSEKWEPADTVSLDGRDDIQFTASDVTEEHKLVINNCTVGGFAVLDENLEQVLPDPQQVGENVEVDFTGWTITGTWTVKFIQGFSGPGGSVTPGPVSWNNVTDKPDSFPPSAHTHAIADVTGLSDALEAAGTVKSVNGNNPNDSGAVTIPNATDTENGLMSAADKEKLDGLSDVAGTVTSVNGIEPDESGNVALNAKTVSSSESVNNITESGTYYVHASASGLPTDGAGGLPADGAGGGAYMMEVIYDKTSGYVLQRITALYNANVQYMRARRGTSSSWDEWRSLSDIISIDSIDPVSARMGGWFWTKFHSNLPLDTTITDEILFADFENKGIPRVQLAFNYTTGDIHMRRSTGAGSWIQMGSSGGRNARWAAGITGVSPNVGDVPAVVDVGKSYSSLVSAVATLSIKRANISNITTQIPVIYYDHHDYSTDSGLLSVYFNVINPPETGYSVNWAVYYQ